MATVDGLAEGVVKTAGPLTDFHEIAETVVPAYETASAWHAVQHPQVTAIATFQAETQVGFDLGVAAMQGRSVTGPTVTAQVQSYATSKAAAQASCPLSEFTQ